LRIRLFVDVNVNVKVKWERKVPMPELAEEAFFLRLGLADALGITRVAKIN
jgi:hypothetical protein